jgi:hypothetical protein
MAHRLEDLTLLRGSSCPNCCLHSNQSLEISIGSFVEIGKLILKFMWKFKGLAEPKKQKEQHCTACLQNRVILA